MKKKKNLLFVFADQWKRSAAGFSGDEAVLTPHMDRFAQQSTRFTNAISACPLCSPARASLLTGKFPLSTGVFTNCKTGYDVRLQDDEICISDLLKQEGYQTGYIGKWHLDEPEQNHSDQPTSGARNWDAYTPPGPRRHGFDFWYSYGAWDEHRTPHYWKNRPEKIQVEEWSPIHETDVAVDFIKNRTVEQPFALFLSWNPPHSPYDTAPQRYKDQYDVDAMVLRKNTVVGTISHHTGEPDNRTEAELKTLQRDYYAAITGLDDQFSRLTQLLQEENLWEDTYVVLTADHGDMLGSHGYMGKHVWYEESIGVPCIMGGSNLPAGVSEIVLNSPDFAPSLLSLLDIPIPATMEGMDCAENILTGAPVEKKVGFVAACPGRDVLLEAFAATGEDPLAFGWRAVRTPHHLYVVDVGYSPVPNHKRYLYSLQDDPLQMMPKELSSATEDPMAEELEEQLRQWMTAQQDGFLRHL